jgi:hypothetical protein
LPSPQYSSTSLFIPVFFSYRKLTPPFLDMQHTQDVWMYIHIGLYVVLIISFLFVWLKNPGYLRHKTDKKLIDVLNNFICYKVCAICEVSGFMWLRVMFLDC